MHMLKRIEVYNYRSCIDCKLDLFDFTPIVGYNNAGKSNIMNAIAWLISPSSSLSESDFYDAENPVIVYGIIEGIGEHLLESLDENHRTRIEPYCSNGVLEIRRIQAIPSRYKRDISLFVKNPDPNGEEDSEWDKNPTGIDQAISAIFPDIIEVEAMKDAGEDVSKFKTSTTIGKLISRIMEPIREEHGQSIKEDLSDLKDKLDSTGNNRPTEIIEFDSQITEELATIFPGIELRLHIPTPNFDDLFKSGTLKAYENETDQGRDISYLGHGAQRSIQMTLIRHLSSLEDGNEYGSRQLLIVEEPELFLHPHAIEQTMHALKSLSNSGYQVIFSTHSPIAISSEDIPYTLLVRKNIDEGTFVIDSMSSTVKKEIEDSPSQAETIFSLSHSSQILFSDQIILAEGKTERKLLPFIFEQIFEVSLGYKKIALIDQGGVDATGNAMKILEAMNIPTKAIVDLDFAFRGAIHARLLTEDDEDIQTCLEIFNDLSEDHPFNLAEDDLPTRSGSELTSTEAFLLLSQDDRSQAAIENIHRKLLEKNIWIWRLCDIEHVLGISGKTDSVWARFQRECKEEGLDSSTDYPDRIREMFEWIIN